jgi:hypothetical protein
MPEDPEGKGPADRSAPADEPQEQPSTKSETMTEIDLVLPHQIAMKQLRLEEENVAKARPVRQLPSVEVKEEKDEEVDDDDRPTKLDLRTLRHGSDLVPEFSPGDFPTPVPPAIPAGDQAPQKQEQKQEDDDTRTTDPDVETPYKGSDAQPQPMSSKPTVEVRTGIREKERKSRTSIVVVVTILVLAAFCLGYLLGRTTG